MRSEALTCSNYAARLDDAQIDKFQDRVGLDYEADAVAAFAEDFGGPCAYDRCYTRATATWI